MTTGSVTIGNASSSPIYYYHSWSGSNGKTVQLPVQAQYFLVRVRVAEPVFIQYLHRVLLKRRSRGQKEISYWETRKKMIQPPIYATKLVKRNHLPFLKDSWNNFTMQVMEGSQVLATKQLPNHPYQTWIGLSLSPTITWDAIDENKLLGKLADAVRGHSFNLGVVLGEAHQTIDLVVQNLRRIRGSLIALRHGRIDIALRHLGANPLPQHRSRQKRLDFSNGRKTMGGDVVGPRGLTSKDVSSMWLEIQYGWQPLFVDIYNSMQAFSALNDKKRSSRVIVTHRKKIHRDLGNSELNKLIDETFDKRIIYEMTEKLSIARSLGLADPRPVLWEICPFSFVVDWFLPIGIYLDNLAVMPFLEGRFLISERRKLVQKASGKDSSIQYWKGLANGRSINYVRSSSTGISVPFPGFKNPFSSGHVKNAIALIHQAVDFSKKAPPFTVPKIKQYYDWSHISKRG